MVVHPRSHGISRAPRYSGYSLMQLGFRLQGSHPLWPAFPCRSANLLHRCVSPNPGRSAHCALSSAHCAERPVWPPPRSLATTSGISVDVFSSPYLDVSVRAVPRIRLFCSAYADRVWPCRVSPFGNLRIYRVCAAPRSLSQLVTSFVGS